MSNEGGKSAEIKENELYSFFTKNRDKITLHKDPNTYEHPEIDLHPQEKDCAVTKDKKLGFLNSSCLLCFDTEKKEILWEKKMPWSAPKLKLDEENEKLILQDLSEPRAASSPKMKITLNYDGDIVEVKNFTMEKFTKREYDDPILEERQKTIASWLYNILYLKDDDLRDILSTKEEVKKDFNKHKTSSDDFLKKEERRLLEQYGKSKGKEDKIDSLKEFLPEDFEGKVIKEFEKRRNLESMLRGSWRFVRKVVGSEKYKEIKNELSFPIGNLSSHYVGNIIANYLSENEIEGDGDNEIKKCEYCGRFFYPSLISSYLRKYIPEEINIGDIQFCQSCLKSALLGRYKRKKDKEEMIRDLENLVEKLGFIPDQNYFLNSNFTRNLSPELFNKAIPALIEILPYRTNDKMLKFFSVSSVPLDGKNEIKEQFEKNTYSNIFGSWLKSLLATDLLENGVRETPRGYMCLAEDGHECRSLGEKNVDDWLHREGISHKKEPKYPEDEELNPNGRMRADWKVEDALIEFFGLSGDVEYDKKTETKREICEKYNISLIEIFEEDLGKLSKKLGKLK